MNIIRDKIDKFIRKYYTNRIIVGAIILLGIFLLLFLAGIIIENFAWLSPSGRAAIFWSIIAINFLIFIYFIAIPLCKMLRLGKVISYHEAAKIIGRFFPEIKDKLLNYLQLEEMQQDGKTNQELLLASLNQKIDELKPFNFANAVDIKTIKKSLKFVIPLVMVFAIIFIVKPSFIKHPAERIINHNVTYEKPQPFYFHLLNKDLTGVENKDFTVNFAVTGEKLPENVSLNFQSRNGSESSTYMTKIDDTTYNYTFKGLRNELTFYASAGEIISDIYTVEIHPVPVIIGFSLHLDYPEYTNREDETIENTGVLKILSGTSGEWTFSTKDADGLIVTNDNKTDTLRNDTAKKNGTITMKSLFKEDCTISVIAYNEHIYNNDTLVYNIQLIDDLHPDIQVSQVHDTISSRHIYFTGTISDDYGFSSLKMYYKHIAENNENQDYIFQDVPFDETLTMQRFYWDINLDEAGIKLGEGIEYYFEVCDNDAVKGYKCIKSQTNVFNRKTIEEMDLLSENISEGIKDNLENTIEGIEEMQRQLDDMLYELQNKEQLTFQDKEKLENMLEQQKQMMEDLQEQQQQMQLNNFNQNEYNEFSEEILKKQEMINELFEKILNEDMKKMMEEIEKMLEQFNKDKIGEEIRDYKSDNEDLEEFLDKTLEMYKSLEFEQEFEKTMSRLDSMSKDQQNLSEKTEESSKSDLDKLSEEQNKLNEEFDKLSEQMDKLEQMNDNLEKSLDIDFDKQEMDDIKSDMQNSSEELDKNNKQKAAKSQKNAAKKMEQMSQKMRQQFNDAMYSQAAEDAEDVRRLLENVIHLSFKEEQLMKELEITRRGNPKYIEIIHRQNEINSQLAMISDTLAAIGRRNYEISNFVFTELSNLKEHSQSTTDNLASGSYVKAKKELQLTMNSLNVFALMLAESLDDMDANMSNMPSCPNGKKSKNQGSSGAPNIKSIKDLQEQLQKQMEQMKNSQGKNPMGLSGEQSSSSSSEFAKMAMQQEAIRRQLEKLQQEMRKNGEGLNGELQEAIKAMEQNEVDLINKRITDEMLERQQEIMTRLLQHEKAEKEREQDNKRESKQGKFFDRKSPEEIFNDEKSQEKFDDELRTMPANLNNYYKQKVDKYRYELKKQIK